MWRYGWALPEGVRCRDMPLRNAPFVYEDGDLLMGERSLLMGERVGE